GDGHLVRRRDRGHGRLGRPRRPDRGGDRVSYLAILTVACLAWALFERRGRMQANRSVVDAMRRTGTPSARESALVGQVDDLERQLIRAQSFRRLAETERREAIHQLEAMRASLHNKVQAQREEREAS